MGGGAKADGGEEGTSFSARGCAESRASKPGRGNHGAAGKLPQVNGGRPSICSLHDAPTSTGVKSDTDGTGMGRPSVACTCCSQQGSMHCFLLQASEVSMSNEIVGHGAMSTLAPSWPTIRVDLADASAAPAVAAVGTRPLYTIAVPSGSAYQEDGMRPPQEEPRHADRGRILVD